MPRAPTGAAAAPRRRRAVAARAAGAPARLTPSRSAAAASRDDPVDLYRAGNEALLAANVAEGDAGAAAVLAFDDTGAYRLLLPAMSEDPAELQRFYAETVEPLVAYDEQYETDLVRHVETFLDCRRQRRRRPPQRLFTHRHTVRYRLERVRELSGLDVGSTDGREKLSSGLKAMRVLGIATARRAGERGGAERRARPARRQGPLTVADARDHHRVGDVRAARLRGAGAPEPVDDALGRGARLRAGASRGVDVAARLAPRRGPPPPVQPGHPPGEHRGAARARRSSAIVGVTVCGARRPDGRARLADRASTTCTSSPTGCRDGRSCTFHAEPGDPVAGTGSSRSRSRAPLRAALLAGAREAGVELRDGGCYGHVDGPRFNTKAEIRGLARLRA